MAVSSSSCHFYIIFVSGKEFVVNPEVGDDVGKVFQQQRLCKYGAKSEDSRRRFARSV